MTTQVQKLWEESSKNLLSLSLIPYALLGAALAIWGIEPGRRPSPADLGLLLLILTLLVWKTRERKVRASWLLGLGTLGGVLAASLLFGTVHSFIYLSYPVLVMFLVLKPTWGFLLAGTFTAVAGFLSWKNLLGEQNGILISSLTTMWASAYIVFLAQRSARAKLLWAWGNYEKMRQELEVSRDQQVKLKQALEDLALVTEEKARLSEMLLAARKSLEEARKAKEEFVAHVSHELRTPLNMIIGFSDMILESPEVYATPLPSDLLADIAAIRRNSEHLASLVNDILALAEAETGYMELSKEWISIKELIQEATEAVSALFEKKNLLLEVKVPPDVPPVLCDRTRIRQVILNLLSNAGRFTEKGKIQVQAKKQDHLLIVSVTDTGPGIAPEKLERLFQPFQQGDSSVRERYGGSGLGLAISKRLIEMHGGHIWVESQPGVGTSVIFALPLDPHLSSNGPKRWLTPSYEYSSRTRPSEAPQITPSPSVIILEQEEVISHFVRRHLPEVEPLHATNLQEAQTLLEEKGATALVLNEIPSRAILELSELQPSIDIPILVCWASKHRASLPQGIADYLVKPVTRGTLWTSIQHVAPSAKSILLADDDPEARQLFRRMLASLNQDYTFLQASDGESTLKLLRERKPDLLLLDLIMPNVDGFAVLEAKEADPEIRNIPTIIISATDLHQAPLIGKTVLITRTGDLSIGDLMHTLKGIIQSLPPRFAVSKPVEKPAG